MVHVSRFTHTGATHTGATGTQTQGDARTYSQCSLKQGTQAWGQTGAMHAQGCLTHSQGLRTGECTWKAAVETGPLAVGSAVLIGLLTPRDAESDMGTNPGTCSA